MRISVVTPTLNRRVMLEQAVASVAAQEPRRHEHIVVDGGSTDGTLEWVRVRPDLVLIEGPDAGVYDALNKGIARATGDIVVLLNADDRLLPGAFDAWLSAFEARPDVDVVCGVAVVIAGSRELSRIERPAELALDPANVLLGLVAPNARAYRRETLTRVGPFRLDLGLVADRHLLVRLYAANAVSVAVAREIYAYENHLTSLTLAADASVRLRLHRHHLALARAWRDAACPAVRRAAAVLEGRSRAMLGFDALRHGALREALRVLLFADGRGLPPLDVARAVLHRLARGSRGEGREQP